MKCLFRASTCRRNKMALISAMLFSIVALATASETQPNELCQLTGLKVLLKNSCNQSRRVERKVDFRQGLSKIPHWTSQPCKNEQCSNQTRHLTANNGVKTRISESERTASEARDATNKKEMKPKTSNAHSGASKKQMKPISPHDNDEEVKASEADDNKEVKASEGDDDEVVKASERDDDEVVKASEDDDEVVKASEGDDDEVVKASEDDDEVVKASEEDDDEVVKASEDNDEVVKASEGDDDEVVKASEADDDEEVKASEADDDEEVKSSEGDTHNFNIMDTSNHVAAGGIDGDIEEVEVSDADEKVKASEGERVPAGEIDGDKQESQVTDYDTGVKSNEEEKPNSHSKNIVQYQQESRRRAEGRSSRGVSDGAENKKSKQCPNGMVYRENCAICFCLTNSASQVRIKCISKFSKTDCDVVTRIAHCKANRLLYDYQAQCEGKCDCKTPSITTCEKIPCGYFLKMLQEFQDSLA